MNTCEANVSVGDWLVHGYTHQRRGWFPICHQGQRNSSITDIPVLESGPLL